MARSTGEVLDDWLVMTAQHGDAGAFEALARRWNRRLIALAYRRTGQIEGAAEAAQEAWLAIVRGLPGLDDPARFPIWASRIVDRKAIDWVRRRQRSRATNSGIGPDEVEGPALENDRRDEVDRLRVLLRSLPDDQRTLLGLFYTEGRSVREIAGVLGIPEGTVKSRLFHARKFLKEKLGD